MYLPPNQVEPGRGVIKGVASYHHFVTVFIGILLDISSMIIYFSHPIESLPVTVNTYIHTHTYFFNQTVTLNAYYYLSFSNVQ